MSKHSLRIATWNIGSNKNYDAVAAKIAQLDIDICAVQEVSLDPAADLPVIFGRGQGNTSGYCWYFTPALAPEELGGGKYEYYGLAIIYSDSSIVRKTACHWAILGFVMVHDLRRLFVSR